MAETRIAAATDSTPRAARTRKPAKAAEVLAREIVDHILRAQLPPGTRLPNEKQMVETTGRARSTLREALRLLESRGIIEMKPGVAGGPIVRNPRPADLGEALTLILMFANVTLLDVMTARQDIELATFDRAIPRLKARHLDAMQNAVDVQRAQIDDRDALLAESRRFHAVINEAAESPVMGILTDALQSTTQMSTVSAEYSWMHRRQVVDEHAAIVEALRAGDHERARDIMREHVRSSIRYWQQAAGQTLSPRQRWLASQELGYSQV